MIRRNVPAAACAMELVGDKLQPGGKQAERPAPGLAHVTLGLVPKPRIGIVGRVDEKWIASCSELQAPRSSTDPKLATDRTLGKLSVTCGPACMWLWLTIEERASEGAGKDGGRGIEAGRDGGDGGDGGAGVQEQSGGERSGFRVPDGREMVHDQQGAVAIRSADAALRSGEHEAQKLAAEAEAAAIEVHVHDAAGGHEEEQEEEEARDLLLRLGRGRAAGRAPFPALGGAQEHRGRHAAPADGLRGGAPQGRPAPRHLLRLRRQMAGPRLRAHARALRSAAPPSDPPPRRRPLHIHPSPETRLRQNRPRASSTFAADRQPIPSPSSTSAERGRDEQAAENLSQVPSIMSSHRPTPDLCTAPASESIVPFER
ncbi:hypothetical protein AXG93_3569s1070 [Marchantia polymorpha subsp. ruderalis]|uniref:Uncharacterized protein n=1 Tax=Marchantia polymorpha subsp. ruderalis TaxID=1480154 RepID=A0A176WJW6_MARPO|nr:hypothetical protein AXG93_3569s1070 [Marchantia polymorpha subsp. ruderalis]